MRQQPGLVLARMLPRPSSWWVMGLPQPWHFVSGRPLKSMEAMPQQDENGVLLNGPEV